MRGAERALHAIPSPPNRVGDMPPEIFVWSLKPISGRFSGPRRALKGQTSNARITCWIDKPQFL
jgi:hypothetical protein